MSARVVAAVFPGQGSERPGVGLEWLDDPLLDAVSARVGVDARRLLARFAPEMFRTSVLQPLLLALSLAAWRRLVARGVSVAFLAGHSVGEIGAWAAAGGLLPVDAIGLAAVRGRAMEREAARRKGAMLALPAGVDLERVLAEGRTEGELVLAAENGPSQSVVSGDASAVARAQRSFGGRMLAVSGAWHSPLMSGARDDLERALRESTICRSSTGARLVSGLDGRLVEPGGRPDLVAQLLAPVQWRRVMDTFSRLAVTDVVALAPGRTSRGLLRDGLGDAVRVHVADSDRDLDVIARTLTDGAGSA